MTNSFIIGCTIIILVVASFAIATEPLFQFWKPKEQRELENCFEKMPTINYSLTGENYCFTKYWNEYCKVSYPQDCPKDPQDERKNT